VEIRLSAFFSIIVRLWHRQVDPRRTMIADRFFCSGDYRRRSMIW
jgi:hypothetical protein